MAWLRYDQNIIPRAEKEWTLRGTLIHLAMAYHYASLRPVEYRPRWYTAHSLEEALWARAGTYAYSPNAVQCAKEVLLAYREHYVDDGWVPVAIEREFGARLGDLDPLGPGVPDPLADFIVTCRPDLVVRDRTGYLREIDYKSRRAQKRSRNTDTYGLEPWSDEGEFALDWQVIMNLHVLRRAIPMSFGYVDDFIVQRMTRQPDPSGKYHFDRHPLTTPAGPYQEAPRMIRHAVEADAARQAKGYVDVSDVPPSLWACWGRYGACDYRPICMGRDRETRLRIINEQYERE